jgi:hypothetical protein
MIDAAIPATITNLLPNFLSNATREELEQIEDEEINPQREAAVENYPVDEVQQFIGSDGDKSIDYNDDDNEYSNSSDSEN